MAVTWPQPWRTDGCHSIASRPAVPPRSDWRNMSLYGHVLHMNFSAFERLIPGTSDTYGSKVWYL